MKRFQGFPLQLIPHSPQQAGNKTNLQDEELHSYHQHWFIAKTQDVKNFSSKFFIFPPTRSARLEKVTEWLL